MRVFCRIHPQCARLQRFAFFLEFFTLARSDSTTDYRYDLGIRVSVWGSKVPQPDSCTATNHYSIRSDRKLFQSENSDAAELALLNEVDESNVGIVKCVMSHGRSGLPRFLAQPLVHPEPLFEYRPPFLGQVND